MAGAGQPFDQGQHQLGLGDAQRGGRLVHDDQLGLLHDRLGYRDRLPLPAGQRSDRLPDRPHGRDPQVLQGLLGGQLHLDLVEQPEPRDLVAEQHVRHDVQVVGQRQVLVHGRDPEVGRVPGRVQVHRLALPHQVAGGRLVDAGDALDQRALARAVVPDQGGDLPGRDVQVDAGQRLHRAEALADVLQPQQRRVTVGLRADRRGGGWHPVRGPGAILGAVRYHLEAPACSTTSIVTQKYRTSSSPRRTSPSTAGTRARSRP